MKKFLALLVLFLCSVSVFSQRNVTDSIHEDSLFDYSLDENDKHYIVALTGSLIPSALFYSWNNYVLQAGWAKVDDDEMSAFYNRDLEYDTDWVSTNFLGHPYQGSLYYLSGRSANLNMFESFAISVLGSYVWEFICEANAPSINDMAYTTIGAFALGEMLNKLSHQADENVYAFHYLLNPISMYSDLFLGIRPVNNQDNITMLNTWIGISSAVGNGGPISNDYNNILEKYPFFAKSGIEINYNDAYGHDSKEPYDQFELCFYGGVGPGTGIRQEKVLEEELSYNTTLFSKGVLKTFSLDINEYIDTTIGFSMLYDYAWLNFYEFTSLAPAFYFAQRINGEKSLFSYQTNIGFNLLGITEFNYYRRRYIENPSRFRSYNYVFGLEMYNSLNFENKKNIFNFNSRIFASCNFYDPRIKNYSGWNFYSLNQLSYEYLFSKSIGIGLQYDFYINYSYYHSLPNYLSYYNEVELFVKWHLK